MNILTTYFTVSRLFTFVREEMMYVEFNSVTLFTVLYFAISKLRKRCVQGHCAAYHFRVVYNELTSRVTKSELFCPNCLILLIKC